MNYTLNRNEKNKFCIYQLNITITNIYIYIYIYVYIYIYWNTTMKKFSSNSRDRETRGSDGGKFENIRSEVNTVQCGKISSN